jgi:alkaline phosphatase D
MNKPASVILGPIIGGLSHERANFWARADGKSSLHAWLAAKRDGSDAKLIGKTQLRADSGFAGTVTATGLKPAKKYFFALTLDPKLIPPKKEFRPFTTFPAPGRAKSFRFAFGSCYKPVRENPGLAFRHLLERHGDVSFLFMLGDQIYADDPHTNGLGHIALTLDDYRRVYDHTWRNEHHRALLAQTPVFMILDDHEIDNDWHWHDQARTRADIPFYTRLIRRFQRHDPEAKILSASRARAALQANWEHQAAHAPAKLPPLGPLAYEFEYGAAAFFVMDTRTQRVNLKSHRTMLGEKQWQMFEDWLMRVKDTHPVKFIVSSIAILSDFLGDVTADRWTGFKDERNRLLHLLAREGVEGVHFLTGDLHSAHSISAELYGPNGRAIPIWEFCSSPFEQKPSRLAWLFDRPAKSPALRNQKTHFVVGEVNYGIVRVDFAGRKPRVRFELHYEKDGEWDVKP